MPQIRPNCLSPSSCAMGAAEQHQLSRLLLEANDHELPVVHHAPCFDRTLHRLSEHYHHFYFQQSPFQHLSIPFYHLLPGTISEGSGRVLSKTSSLIWTGSSFFNLFDTLRPVWPWLGSNSEEQVGTVPKLSQTWWWNQTIQTKFWGYMKRRQTWFPTPKHASTTHTAVDLCPLHSSRALQLDNVFCIGTPLAVLQFPLPVWRC